MKLKLVTTLCVMTWFLAAGCRTVDDILDATRTDDGTDGANPPQCAISVNLDGLEYAGSWECAYVTVTISNTSPDETARNAQCAVTLMDGGSAAVSAGLYAGDIEPGGIVSISTSLTANAMHGESEEFEWSATWQDDWGATYSSQRSAGLHL